MHGTRVTPGGACRLALNGASRGCGRAHATAGVGDISPLQPVPPIRPRKEPEERQRQPTPPRLPDPCPDEAPEAPGRPLDEYADSRCQAFDPDIRPEGVAREKRGMRVGTLSAE